MVFMQRWRPTWLDLPDGMAHHGRKPRIAVAFFYSPPASRPLQSAIGDPCSRACQDYRLYWFNCSCRLQLITSFCLLRAAPKAVPFFAYALKVCDQVVCLCAWCTKFPDSLFFPKVIVCQSWEGNKVKFELAVLGNTFIAWVNRVTTFLVFSNWFVLMHFWPLSVFCECESIFETELDTWSPQPWLWGHFEKYEYYN